METPKLSTSLDKKIKASKKGASEILNILHALRHGEVEFANEAVIKISTASVLYHEHLLRVKDVNGNKIPTEKVFNALEKWDLLAVVGQYLIELALVQAIENKCIVGLNIPPQLFEQENFRNHLEESLKQAEADGMLPQQVFLEIVENPGMLVDESMEEMFLWLNEATEKGYSIGLDDFGDINGSHTIDHLKNLPNSFLKLDGSVVNKMLDGSFNVAEYEEVFAYCKANNIHIIAEHVTNVKDAKMLAKKYPITHIQSKYVQPSDFL